MGRRDAVREAAVLLLFLALAAAMTWPLARELERAVVQPAEDPQLNSWIMAWDAHALLTEPAHLFQGNIFYPYPYALAYSEHLLGSAVLGLPFQLLWRNAVAVHNLLVLLSFALSGFGAYLLGRRLSGSRAAGLIAGLVFAFCPYKMGQLHHFQNLSAQWMPFALLFLERVVRQGRRRDMFLLGLFIVLQGFSSVYYTLFLAVGLVIAAAIMLLGQWWGAWRVAARRLGALALTGLLAGAVLVPVYLPYARAAELLDAGRSLSYVTQLSPDALNYLATPAGNLLYGTLTAPWRKEPEGALWPGLLALLLAGAGLWAGLRARSRAVRTWCWTLLALALTAGVLSLGPTIHLAGRALVRGPYILLWRYLPGFQAVRVPARFAVLVMLGLAGLAAVGMGHLLGDGRARWRRLAGGAAALLIVLEYWSAPLPLAQAYTASPTPEVYRWLAEQPADVSVLELPIDVYPAFSHDILYLGQSTRHWRRLVNGYSGIFPPGYLALSRMMQDFPSQETVDVLRRLGVDYVIVHRDQLPPDQLERFTPDFYTELEGLTWAGVFGPAWVYRLTPPDADFSRLTLGSPAARPFLLGGWSPFDDRIAGRPVTWSIGDKSYLLVPIWDQARSVVLGVQSAADQVHCRLTWDGRSLGEWHFFGGAETYYSLPLPRRAGPGLYILGWDCAGGKAEAHARTIGETGVEAPADLAVVAAGRDAGDYAAIYLEGKQYLVAEECRSCLEVLALPPGDHTAPLWRVADLAVPAERFSLAEWLMALPDGTVIAAAGRAGAGVSLDLIRALAHYGGSGRMVKDVGQAYLLIGVRGALLGTAVERACDEGCWEYLGAPWPDRRLAVSRVEAVR